MKILELTQEEYNMIANRIKDMRCIVRDSHEFDDKDICNGDCNENCNRPELCNPVKWLESKVVYDSSTANRTEMLAAVSDLSEIKSSYNLFDPAERPKYHACGLGIEFIRKLHHEIFGV